MVNFTKPIGYSYAPLHYDAIWAIALALNRTLIKIKERGMFYFNTYFLFIIQTTLHIIQNDNDLLFISLGINKTLDQVSYADGDIQEMIAESFYEIEFTGVKDYTKFDRSGEASGLIGIYQQQGTRPSNPCSAITLRYIFVTHVSEALDTLNPKPAKSVNF